jgi:hypothetical protein
MCSLRLASPALHSHHRRVTGHFTASEGVGGGGEEGGFAAGGIAVGPPKSSRISESLIFFFPFPGGGQSRQFTEDELFCAAPRTLIRPMLSGPAGLPKEIVDLLANW